MEPWENDGEGWKGEGADEGRKIPIGARCFFSQGQRGEALPVIEMEGNVPSLDESNGTNSKTFEGGIYVGEPDQCPWLPWTIKNKLEDSPFPVMLFVGTPVGENQLYLFCIEMPSDEGDTEIEFEE